MSSYLQIILIHPSLLVRLNVNYLQYRRKYFIVLSLIDNIR